MNWYKRLVLVPRISPALLVEAFPRIKEPKAWAKAMNEGFMMHPTAVQDVASLAVLLAQLGHECSSFNDLEESLYYSADRLRAVWPARFPSDEVAERYARNPEALANRVYAGRMGNVKKGDGWRHRGRGCPMLTGRYNYEAMQRDTGLPVMDNPDNLLDKLVAFRAGLWYWDTRVSHKHKRDIVTSTKELNGGFNGLDDRKHHHKRVRAALQEWYR